MTIEAVDVSVFAPHLRKRGFDNVPISARDDVSDDLLIRAHMCLEIGDEPRRDERLLSLGAGTENILVRHHIR